MRSKNALLIFEIERKREERRGGERGNIEVRNFSQLALVCSDPDPDRDQTCNPVMCPDQESDLPLFALRDNTQPTEPRQSGLNQLF